MVFLGHGIEDDVVTLKNYQLGRDIIKNEG